MLTFARESYLGRSPCPTSPISKKKTSSLTMFPSCVVQLKRTHQLSYSRRSVPWQRSSSVVWKLQCLENGRPHMCTQGESGSSHGGIPSRPAAAAAKCGVLRCGVTNYLEQRVLSPFCGRRLCVWIWNGVVLGQGGLGLLQYLGFL